MGPGDEMSAWAIQFKLNRASYLEAHREKDGIRASVQIGSDALRVDNIPATSECAARDLAEPLANELLDTLAHRYDEPLEIVPLPWRSEHAAESGATVVGQHLGNTVSSRGSLSLKKIDAQGNVVQVYDSDRPGRIEVKPSQAAPYYRRASLSADPFDKFRNFFLVAENVADQIRLSRHQGKLKERASLAQALRVVFNQNSGSLLQAAQAVPDFVAAADLFDDVAGLLYEGHRCQINHAKAQQSKKVPFNPHDEETVRGALPLIQFVARSLLDYEGAHL